MGGRTCVECGKTKPLTSFYRNGKRADGRQMYTTDCIKCRTGGRSREEERALAIKLWDQGASINVLRKTIRRTHGTITRWLRAAGRDTGSRRAPYTGYTTTGNPDGAAEIGQSPTFAAVDAAIMRDRLAAGMLDGKVRIFTEVGIRSSLGGDIL